MPLKEQAMGYSNSYRVHIPVQLSGNISYPASERGGSKSVVLRDNWPVDVRVNVDTDSFDSSVKGCNNSVDLLTGAVVVMNSAQVAAIQEKTMDVVRSLSSGFFGAINSEISQQLVQLKSSIDSNLALLVEYGKAIDGQKSVMETDYQRIHDRYLGVFRNLDDECRKQIQALDRSAFDLSEKVMAFMLAGLTDKGAGGLVSAQEEASSRSMFLASALYRKTRAVIDSLYAYINQEKVFERQIDVSLIDEKLDEPGPVYLPVLYVESDRVDGAGEVVKECFQPQGTDEQIKSVIAEGAASFGGSENIWTAGTADFMAELNREFNALVEKEYTGDLEQKRINETMLNLWRESRFLVFAKEQRREEE
jgi:hypothetical protein